MLKMSDSDVKRIFRSLKALMFWPHPPEFDPFLKYFHIKESSMLPEPISLAQEDLYREAQEIKSATERFPLSIYIENTNLCNLRCVMCNRGGLTRPHGFMDKDLFEKIVDEIAEKQPSATVSLFYFGEPFVDRNLFEKITYCGRKGLSYLKLSTNGSLLGVDENYKKIVDSGLHHLVISFDAITIKEYEAIRIGSSFDRFIEGVRDLSDYSDSRKHIEMP